MHVEVSVCNMLSNHISVEVDEDVSLITGHPLSLFESEESVAVDASVEGLELAVSQNELKLLLEQSVFELPFRVF